MSQRKERPWSSAQASHPAVESTDSFPFLNIDDCKPLRRFFSLRALLHERVCSAEVKRDDGSSSYAAVFRLADTTGTVLFRCADENGKVLRPNRVYVFIGLQTVLVDGCIVVELLPTSGRFEEDKGGASGGPDSRRALITPSNVKLTNDVSAIEYERTSLAIS